MKQETKDKKGELKELVSNRKAFHQYEILENFEAGIQLTGSEIKSIRDGGGSLQDAYIVVDKGELWLLNSSISPCRFSSYFNHEEKRKRKLLAHKKEIRKIESELQEKGLTCAPLSFYLKNGYVKVRIAIVKGKKTRDRREDIKERDDKRAIQRVMKNNS